MTSETRIAYSLGAREAAYRLAAVESLELSATGLRGNADVTVALPVAYAKRRKQRFPLVVVVNDGSLIGSAIEMCRLMTETREIRPCILVVVSIAAADLARPDAVADVVVEQVLPAVHTRYRVAREPVAVFDALGAVEPALAEVAAVAGLRLLDGRARDVPALVDAFRELLSTGTEYGANVTPLRKPWLMRTMLALSPLLQRLMPAPEPVADRSHLFASESMGREFEVFVSLPASFDATRPHRYPMLLVLDANIEFATAAETAARLAAAGAIEETIVVGLGIPRAEGHLSFGFRRFEEFFPPADGYAHDDDLGRIVRALFATRGQDARERLGLAPALLRCIRDELLPHLSRLLPVDLDALALLGHSAGGTFVGYALLQPTSPFRHYFAVSPGVGISGSWLMRQPTTGLAPRAQTLSLTLGSAEMDNLFNRIAGIPDTEAFGERIRALDRVAVDFHCFPNETHSSVYPRAVARALQSAFASNHHEAAARRQASAP